MKKLFPILVYTWFHGLGQDSIFFQNAEWSPDGKKICAETIRKSGPVLGYEGYIIDIKEKTIQRKIPGAVFPAWSADGKAIAYSKRNSSPHGLDIWIMNTQTGDTTRLTNDTVRSSGVTFSPDGKEICFSSDKGSGRHLFVINTDGSDLHQISFDTARYFNPVWAPGGDEIVYYRELGDHTDKVFTLDVKSGKEMKVTDDTLHNTYPGWLPDGKTISYTYSIPFSNDESGRQTALIDADGRHKRFVPGTVGSFGSRVSPDGNRIAIIKGRWPQSNIYIINMDGSSPDCLTCKLFE